MTNLFVGQIISTQYNILKFYVEKSLYGGNAPPKTIFFKSKKGERIMFEKLEQIKPALKKLIIPRL